MKQIGKHKNGFHNTEHDLHQQNPAEDITRELYQNSIGL